MLLGLRDGFGFSERALSYWSGLDVHSDCLVQEAVMKGGVLRVLGLRWRKRGGFAAWLGIAGNVTSHGEFNEDFWMLDEFWQRDSLRMLFGVKMLKCFILTRR